MTLPDSLFVDGHFQSSSSGTRTQLINPATEEPFAEVAAANGRDVAVAVESAQRAWESGWRNLAPGKRTEVLFNVARALRDNLERIAQLETLQVGKPIGDARDEAALGARVFEYYAGAITKFCGQTIPVARGGFDFTLHQPMGVVAAIAPWNFPFPIACWKAAPALAAGNCVVLKPASLSPLTALKLGELAHAAGLPAGVLQVLPGSGSAIGEALVTHPLVRNVSLTGSVPVIDVTGPEPVEHRGYVPPDSVVVPGTRPKEFPAGTYQIGCALIIGRRSASTRFLALRSSPPVWKNTRRHGSRASVRDAPAPRGRQRIGSARLSKSQSRVSVGSPVRSNTSSSSCRSVSRRPPFATRSHCRQPIPPSLKASPSAGVASSESVSSSRSSSANRVHAISASDEKRETSQRAIGKPNG